MKPITLILILLVSNLALFAGDKDSSKADNELANEKLKELSAFLKTLDSAEKAMQYKTGSVPLSNNVAHINLPAGFKFIDAVQTRYILHKLWGNPEDPSLLGMIVPDSFHLNSANVPWVFTVSYEDMGYVKDDDADNIKYDELLADLRKGQEEANPERKKEGYAAMHLLGWASAPYYDKQNKVLHWAKEFSVEGEDAKTLNYEVRVLGRKGVLSLTAIATMDQLSEVKKNIPAILKMAEYDKGFKYEEFDSGVDKVAAWTIGGLVAGKLLAKAGMLVFLAKFWKLILIGVAGAGAAIKKFFGFRKKDEDTGIVPADAGDTSANA
ncbi:MAG: DUF2167 domain-containing protein [Bacteroidota bacterium]|nr:DUF2167 domain-containing protein [Bacteroidota bacterium]